MYVSVYVCAHVCVCPMCGLTKSVKFFLLFSICFLFAHWSNV